MKMNLSVCFVLCFLLACQKASTLIGAGVPFPAEKKMIEDGWDSPDAQYVADHIKRMEKRPFDGVVFYLRGCGSFCFSQKPMDEAEVEEDFKACARIRGRKFTENFIKVGTTTVGDFDWFDDAQWAAIEDRIHKMAHAGSLAKCAGIMLDYETYSHVGGNPWNYKKTTHHETKSFEEYEAKVRERGAQFIRAWESEMPGLTILTCWQLSYFRNLLHKDETVRRAKLKETGSALMPAFVNGMLDAASPEATIVDGNENAYYYTNKAEYLDARFLILEQTKSFVAPENQEKFRNQVKVAQTMYLDQYFNLRGGVWKPLSQFMVKEEMKAWCEHNAYWALTTSDKYVWCYNEIANWWVDPVEDAKPGVKNVYTMRADIPVEKWIRFGVPEGAEEAIRAARQLYENGEYLPYEMTGILEKVYERRDAKNRNGETPVPDAVRAANLLKNGDFEEGKAHWMESVMPEPAGKFSFAYPSEAFHGSKAARIRVESRDLGGNAGWARIINGVDGLDPAKKYVVDFAFRTTDGAEDCSIWQIASGKDGTSNYTSLGATHGKWYRHVIRDINVPDGKIALYMTIYTKPSSGCVWFDDVIILEQEEYDRLMAQ